MRAAGGLKRAHLGTSAQGAVGRRGFCRQGSGRQTPGWEQAWEALIVGPNNGDGDNDDHDNVVAPSPHAR